MPDAVYRFGECVLDATSGELRRTGNVVRLQPQPLQVLLALLRRPGQVVTRGELRGSLWAEDTYVEFDDGLNHAIRRLRDALGDTAQVPRYIETIPRKGYRLVAPVGRIQEDPNTVGPDSKVPAAGTNGAARGRSTKGFSSFPHRLMLVGSAALLLAVVLGLAAWLRSVPSRRPAARPVLAVLPLENLSGDPEQAYFADGMTEELTTDLAKISSLRVISRSSMMAYKGLNKPLPEIARELQVDALVEGSVQRSGKRVRITAQLIDAPSQQHLWAETYDRDFKDVLSIRDDVARAIAAEVKIKLTPEENRRLTSPHPVDPQAYEAYLMGRYLADRRKPADYEKSIERFQDAIRHDPSYALAYAEMAESYAMLDFMADLRGENFRKAEEAAKQAAALDPYPAEVRIRMADLKMYWDWDWSQCDTAFREAARLNPGSGDAQGHFALCLLVLGRYDEALQEEERARQLDPLSPWMYRWLGQAFYNMGQYQPALQRFRKAIELDPNDAGAYESLAVVYDALHQDENAVLARTSAEFLRGRSPTEVAALRAAFATGGIEAFRARYRGNERQDLKKLVGTVSHTWVSPVRLAGLCVAAGDTDAAFKWLDKAYEHHSPQLVWLKSSIQFAPLRSDPRFTALLARMNFPDSKP